MTMPRFGIRPLLAAALALSLGSTAAPALAAREAKERPSEGSGGSEGDFAAGRLLQRANDLLLAGEEERGIKMLQSVIEQHPDSDARYSAYLALGQHELDNGNQPQAITYFARVKELERREGLTGDTLDLYLESLYLTGVAHYQAQQFNAAFPILRKITTRYPNTVWANQAYYYIGMCHFAQGKWSKAIEALNLVGTFVDASSPTIEYIEAGRRFYIKIDDADLPVLGRLGRETTVRVVSSSGDSVELNTSPLSGDESLHLASVGTEVGVPVADDGVLQVRGGDTLAVDYTDDNTEAGQKDVKREKTVKVVSTAAATFTLGTFDGRAAAAFINQPLSVVVNDADRDTGPDADAVQVRIVSRYQQEEDDTDMNAPPAEGDDTLSGALGIRGDEPRVRWVERDGVDLTLSELGNAPVHTGRFGGVVSITGFDDEVSIDTNDDTLAVALDDQVIVTYTDELHIDGESPRVAVGTVDVAGEIETNVTARQNEVTDDVLHARKNLVEAEAYLELARIFESMGLKDGAAERAGEGLDRVNPIIGMQSPIPRELREQAFQRKWELQIVQGQYEEAIRTCRIFNTLFPDSVLVDQALMGIAEVKSDQESFGEAINVYQQVLALQNSQAKAEAQFRIAGALEELAKQNADKKKDVEYSIRNAESAIRAYQVTAQQYPDSQFAGPALEKMVDYYAATRDYARAVDLLRQTFQDYPDAEFLDAMLFKWMIIAYRMGDLQTSLQKGQELVFQYPGSEYAANAKKYLPQIEAKANAGSGRGGEADAASPPDSDEEPQ